MMGAMSEEIQVIRNDELTVEQIRELQPEAIVLSPGPGRPSEAGVCIDVVKKLGSTHIILGVCLGHQAICEAYGGVITYASRLMHGKQSEVAINCGVDLFQGLPNSIQVARYHSLQADAKTLPDCLQVIAKTAQEEIMGIKHTEYSVYGLQFHPESILTPRGNEILRNFLAIVNKVRDKRV